MLVLTGQLGSGQGRLAINLYTGVSKLRTLAEYFFPSEMLLCDTITRLNEDLP